MARTRRPARKLSRPRPLRLEALDERLALCTAVAGVVTADTTWTNTITGYCVVGDLEVAPGVKLTINPNVPVSTQNNTLEMRVDGTIDIRGARFTGPNNELIIRSGGTLNIDPGTVMNGERLTIEPNTTATISGGTFNLPVDLMTSAATVANSIFTNPALQGTPSSVGQLYNAPVLDNLFATDTIVTVSGTGVADATWLDYPNIKEYNVVGTAVIPSGVDITISSGIIVRMDRDIDDLRIEGSLITEGTEFYGLGTTVIAANGGHLELNRDLADVPTWVRSGTIRYETGSTGQVSQALFEQGELVDYSPGVILDQITFQSIRPVEIWPSLVYDLYDSNFLNTATIRLTGPTSASPKPSLFDRDIQPYLNIGKFQLSGDVTVVAGTNWILGGGSVQPIVETLDPNFEIIVEAGGKLEARNTAFTGAGTEFIAHNGGELRLLDGTSVVGQGASYEAGSLGLLRCIAFGGNLNFNSGSLARTIQNDFTGATMVASGGTLTSINVANQYWGTNNQANIESRITHKNDISSLPQVAFAPVLPNTPYPCASSAPSISPIADQVVEMDQIVGPISFEVQDTDTPVSQLKVTATSNNQQLFANPNIIILGTGATKTLQMIPNPGELGTATITVQVEDAEGFTNEVTFVASVLPADSAPVVFPLPDVSMLEDTLAGPLVIFASDAQSLTENLNVYVSDTSNPDLLPEGMQQIFFDGTNWQVIIQPAPDRFTPTSQTVADTLTIAVDDGSLVTTQTFHVRVNPVDDVPRITVSSTTVPVGVAGADVADVLLFDPDPADAINVSIVNGGADFEIVAGKLKLKPGVSWTSGQSDDITLRAFDPANPSSFSAKTIHVLATSTAPLLRIEFVAEDAFGFPLDQITIGDTFFLAGYVTDLRATPEGVKQVYVDLRHDPAAVAASPEWGTAFPLNQSANPGLGVVNDLGGAADPLLPVVDRQLMFRVNVSDTTGLSATSNTAGTVFVALDSDLARPTQLIDALAPSGFITLSASEVEIIPASIRIARAEAMPTMYVTDGTHLEPIFSGSSTPNVTDGTYFGTFDANDLGGSRTNTFGILNIAAGTLQLTGTPLVSITGPAAADFSVVTPPDPTTGTVAFNDFQIEFNPVGLGLRQAVVTIFSNSPQNNPYTFIIAGHGTEVNKPPTDILLDSTTVFEDTFGAVVGSVTVVDGSISDSFTFNVSDARFEIANGRLKLKSTVALDSAITPTVPMDITATDLGGLSVTKSIVVNVVPPPSTVTVTLEARTLNDQPLTTVVPFQNFKVVVQVADTRLVPLGVQSAYFDLSYTATHVSVSSTNSIQFDPLYPNQQFAGLLTPGLIDELGATADPIAVGAGVKTLATTYFLAKYTTPGLITFTPSLANDSYTTVFGNIAPVIPRDVLLSPLEINLIQPQFPWHNPNTASDVIGFDGIIDVQDILAVIFHFNNQNLDLSQLTLPAPPAIPRFIDVVPDNLVDVQDILRVIYDFNRLVGGGEGESATAVTSLSVQPPISLAALETLLPVSGNEPSEVAADESLLLPTDAATSAPSALLNPSAGRASPVELALLAILAEGGDEEVTSVSPAVTDAILADLAQTLIAVQDRRLTASDSASD